MQLLDIHEPGQTPVPHQEADVAVGIDLGTTNSLIAFSEDNAPEVVRDANGKGMVPSVVAYPDGANEPVVGDLARATILDDPHLVVSSVKRLMGRVLADLKTISGTLPYEIAEADEGQDRMVRLIVGEKHLTPVHVSADILRALRSRAEASLGKPVSKAVITVPAYFDDAARNATKDAARVAGLEVLRLVNEPTAAALAYGLDKGSEGVYAVYDLGGGTFDISILRMEKGVFQVLATGGDSALGGDDFDHAVVERFLAERRSETQSDELSTGDLKHALATARLAKECLTSQDDGEWILGAGDIETRHRLNRETFEELISSLVDRSIDICRDVLLDSGLGAEEIKGVVLVGGSTRVPLVRSRVAELFGQQPLADIDPDEVVALGAALQAEALTVGSDTLLLDVIPLSLGIETMGDLVEKVVPRNSPIPISRAQEFTTYQDGQAAMMIHVVQGERELASQCRSLARFELHGIPPMTAGAARIRVTFAVDADGLLTVSASEATTGVQQEVAVKPSYGLTDEEMVAMLKESMEHAKDDMQARVLAEARVEAERVLLSVASALEADGDLLDQSERAHIDQAMSAVVQACQHTDRDAINQNMENLELATKPFAEKRMDRGIRTALEGVNVDDLKQKVEAGQDETE